MIDEIAEKAKANKGKRNDLTLASADANGDGKEINSKLAELANTSTATVQRMKKVKV